MCPQPFDRLLCGRRSSPSRATLNQWPHQRTAQRNRNDRAFIIAQPLCRRGKSIIKTRLTAKITAVSSIVLEPANFLFFPYSSRVSWPVRHHLAAICSPSQIPLPFGIGFTWLIHTLNGLTRQWEKRKKDRFCVKLPEESGGFGFVRFLAPSAINLPTGRMSSLQGRTGGFCECVCGGGECKLDTGTMNETADKL